MDRVTAQSKGTCGVCGLDIISRIRMLDTFSKKETYQLLIDQETFGVLAIVNSVSILHALAAGITNSSAMNVYLPKVNAYQTLATGDFILGRKSVQALIPSEGNVAKSLSSTPNDTLFALVPYNTPSSNFVEKKTLTSLRAFGISMLEQKIERYLSRAKHFSGDEIFIPFIANELQDPDSLAIKEWASITGNSVFEARAELELKVKTAQIVSLRLNAIWDKYVKRINSLTSADEIGKCVKYDLEIELRSGVQ